MASSTLPGDRRWASTRRSGLTVLGKVAVPKPINLPSQKLENHGLDPNVEIVPKGTLSWGSKSSSSAPNAWASSTLSPTTDGGANSPSRLSARPSSGESGTRPSTAGSDRALDVGLNAWGSNSRPSSASGALSSSQTSVASLRPHSAETRPGSSQLSRFAELSSDNSVTGSVERLGSTSCKNDGFSLSSGDFPVLGSEKTSSGKNASSQGEESVKESVENLIVDASLNADTLNRTESSWRRDNPPQIEDNVRPSMEKWPGDPHFYNPGILPQHLNGWHGPPVTNPPGGVWYRGPPGVPPYGAPVPPSGFPIEPFPFYRPQMPAAGLPNAPPVAPSGAGPRGPRPRGGDMYRPQMPDPYIRPGMPMRPGFYSGPIHYDGFFGPPMGYCNPNERDIPFMGMPNGPPSVYGRYPGHHAPETSNTHPRSVGYCSDSKAPASEVEPGHHPETPGQYKVLLKQHNEWDGKNEENKPEEAAVAGKTCLDKGDFLQSSSWEDDWTMDHKRDEVKHSDSAPFGEVTYQKFDNLVGSLPMKVQSHENADNVRVDGSAGRRLDYGHPIHPEVPPPSVAASRDSSLIQKIEGLNAKARSSDGKQEDSHFPSRLEQENKKFLAADSRFSQSVAESGGHSQHVAKTVVTGNLNPTSLEMSITSGGRSFEQSSNGANAFRKHPHGVQGKSYHHGKGRFTTHDGDGWRKKSSPTELLDVVPAMPLDTSSSYMQAHVTSPKAKDISGSHNALKDGVGTVPAKSDQHVNQAERAKMKELAKQRPKQRQEVEDERIRDQKAKTLMKSEELNKRMQIGEGSNPKPDNVSNDGISNKPWSSRPDPETMPVPVQEDVGPTDLVDKSTAPSIGNIGSSKQRRVADKQRQNPPLDKTLNTESQKVDTDAANDTFFEVVSKERASSSEANLSVRPHHVADAPAHQRRKSNKSARYKHKADEVPPASSLSSTTPTETNEAIASEENSGTKVQDSELVPSAAESLMGSKMANQPSEQFSTLTNEETQTRVGHQWKSQHPRRPSRNPQANRSTERFRGGEGVVWAPVQSQKIENADEASDRTQTEGLNSSTKIDHTVHHNPKKKRDEMERYVPKPVAKEMALQGSIHQQMADSSNKNLADDSGQKGDSNYQAIENIPHTGSTIGKEVKNVEGRHGKPGRSYGSWRQRVSTESSNLQRPAGGQFPTSGLGKDDQMRVEHHQSHKPEGRSSREQVKDSHEWCSNDGPDIPSDSNSVPQGTSYDTREHGTTGRGKRQPFRGQKGAGTSVNLDQTKSSDDLEKNQSLAPELSQTGVAASKENPSVGERSMSHWQPKSQNFSSHNHRRGRPSGVRVDESSRDDALYQQPKEAPEASAAPVHDRDISGKDNVGAAGNLETRRGRKAPFSGGHPHSPVQDSVKPMDSGPAGEDGQEARTSSGFRKNSNQNSRYGRGNEYRGEWNSSGQDNRQQNVPVNRERQRQYSKYQPVGAAGDNRSDFNEEPKDGSHSTGTRFKERGNRRGGNFREWHGGNTGADGGRCQ